MMIIDATNLVVGRMATRIAKAALLGNKVEIVNCQDAVVTGNQDDLIKNFTDRTKRGEPFHGPFYPRREDMLIRRMIRGMLPWKTARGKAAFKNIMCYIGVPEHLNGKKFETIKEANISNVKKARYLRIGEISKYIGKTI